MYTDEDFCTYRLFLKSECQIYPGVFYNVDQMNIPNIKRSFEQASALEFH